MKKITVEIAETPTALAYGLMNRQKMPDDHGMLFRFPSVSTLSFWGKDTYIPLDIAFIKDNRVMDIQKITPLSTKPIYSKDLCNIAIEVNGGFFKKNGIEVGHQIKCHDKEVTFYVTNH